MFRRAFAPLLAALLITPAADAFEVDSAGTGASHAPRPRGRQADDAGKSASVRAVTQKQAASHATTG